MKKSTVAVMAAAGTAAAAVSIPYFYRQNNDLRASHFVFRSPKVRGRLDGFRIVQVSDLHNREFGKGNCHLLALLEAQLPNLIVITGDLVDSYHPNPERALRFCRAAAKAAPCYFVTGNHEHRMSRERLEDFLRRVEDCGVTVLRSRAVELTPYAMQAEGTTADSFRLIGVDCQKGRTDTLQRLMKDRDPGELNILLSHKPHYAEYCEKAGVDLVLTGHAHGGQWRLPLIGGIYAPGQGLLPSYTGGMYRLGKTVMCVSRGLGNSSFPLRIANKPELVTVTLHAEA